MRGSAARLYLQPLGLVGAPRAAELVAAGAALPLAGGPLAFTAALVATRSDEGPALRTPLALADLRERAGADARVAALLERVCAPRPGAGDRPRLMGIVNVTPDSFSDGGRYLEARAAIEHGRALAAEGAAIVDVGGESTRPGAEPVAPEAELARVLPVIEGLHGARAALAGAAISIDTRHAAVMGAAVAAGADIINDVSALTTDADSVAVAAAAGVPVALMHMPGTPETMRDAPPYRDVALDVYDYLEERVEACLAAGIARERLIVDPGFGFGKRGPENQALLGALALFHGLGCPLLVGLSRKGLGDRRGRELAPSERLPASLAAALAALDRGAQLLRVHDVAASAQALDLWLGLQELA